MLETNAKLDKLKEELKTEERPSSERANKSGILSDIVNVSRLAFLSHDDGS